MEDLSKNPYREKFKEKILSIVNSKGGGEMDSKGYFDEVAKNWDKMRESFFSESVREKAFSIAGVEKGKLAVDMGAGTGFITEGLVQRGVKVIAVDQSSEMLEEMKRKFGNSDQVEFLLGQAENIPIKDEAVDYVFANMFLHHVEVPLVAIKEMARILKPGGKLVITDLDKHEFEFLKIEQFDLWMGFDRDDVKKWLKEAGLKEVEITCTGEECCSKSTCGEEKAQISIFAASGRK